MTQPFKDKPPRATKEMIHRLSENGDGAVQWGLETDFDLSEVMTPGFFTLVGKHGFKKHDRVYVVCRQHEPIATHAQITLFCRDNAHIVECARTAHIERDRHATPQCLLSNLTVSGLVSPVQIDLSA